MLYSNHEMEQRDSLFFRSTQRREINKNDFVRTMTPQILVLLLATVATVYSACDNHCSGHGTCNTDDVCTCYDNWGIGQAHDSGDCSERVCPYELAWVDDPRHECSQPLVDGQREPAHTGTTTARAALDKQ